MEKNPIEKLQALERICIFLVVGQVVQTFFNISFSVRIASIRTSITDILGITQGIVQIVDAISKGHLSI